MPANWILAIATVVVLSGGLLRAQSPSVWSGYGQGARDWLEIDIGTIGLARQALESQTLAFDSMGNEILNADSLTSSMQFGFRTMVGIRGIQPWLGGTDLQLGYFGINSLDAGRTVSADEVNAIFFGGIPTDPPTSFAFNYSSNLYSGEVNLRFASGSRLRPLVGLRFFKLEDTYDVFESSSNGPDGFYSLTNNRLFGTQFGLEGDLWQTRRANFYGFGKVGAMHNDVEGTATARNAHIIFNDSVFTTLVDAGVGAKFRFAGPFSFTVGYRTIFVGDIASGMNQNAALSMFDWSNEVQLDSQHWHGLDLGAVFEF